MGFEQEFPNPADRFTGRVSSHDSRLDVIERQLVKATPWILVGSGGSAPAFVGTWANSGGAWSPVRFRRRGDMVDLVGTCTGGSATSGSIIFTLPIGYRPLGGQQSFATEGNAEFKWFLVNQAGQVLWYCPSTQTPSTSSFHFAHSFPIA